MNPNDPFSALGGERTIIKPRLGKPASQAIQSLDNILGPGVKADTNSEASISLSQSRFDNALQQLKESPAASKNMLLVHASHCCAWCVPWAARQKYLHRKLWLTHGQKA